MTAALPVVAPRAGLAGWSLFAALIAMAGLPIYIHAPKFYVDTYGVSLAALGGWLFAGASRTAGGQVSDMADTRLHHVLVAQVLVDGLGLSRGFHNDQRFAHGSENS